MTSRILVDFANRVKELHDTGMTGEGTYRPTICDLFKSLGPDIEALNEPGRIECGAPDFFVTRNGNVVGHIEHKDIGVNLQNMRGANKDQQERYIKALPNLIYTNCNNWDFYRDGELVESVSLESDSEKLEFLLREFVAHKPLSISDPEKLAERMARKTTLLRIALEKKLGGKKRCDEIVSHYNAFSQTIMRGKSKKEFAELYAETITYGMFAARMNVSDDREFTRSEAGKNLPKNNPFLRNLFRYIFSRDLDNDLDWIIDDLANLLSACKVQELMKKFKKIEGKEDPFLHFFETFLEAYDPARRKENGVYYTPQQAVNFIVRAVDQVLRDELRIADGLADISTIPGAKYENGNDLHRVRLLDPATGTGTFLVEAIRQIAPKVRKRVESKTAWTKYVETHLIPRLHGFEILMAPYAMCFAKIDMVLKALNYTPSKEPSRLEVYLNDALDLGQKQLVLPGLEWLSNEANLASLIKHGGKPIMCVLGNPPYNANVSAPDKKEMMHKLLEKYKMEPGKDRFLKERTTGHLNDLYLQFMRISSYLVEKNGEGVIGLITNNRYLDGATLRGVRYHLQKTFDKIWIVNLHGDSSRGEKTPDGNADYNIFGITKGVAIIIAAKAKKDRDMENEMAITKSIDLWGSRELKLQRLSEMTLSDSEFETVESSEPYYFFVNSDNKNRDTYDSGFGMEEMMPSPKTRSGFTTAMDKFSLGMTKEELRDRLHGFSGMSDEDAKSYLKPFLRTANKVNNVDFWNNLRKDVKSMDDSLFEEFTYRPFDRRWVYYTGRSKGLIHGTGAKAMKLMKIPNNIAIAVSNGYNLDGDYKHAFCHQGLCDYALVSTITGEICSVFPLLDPSSEVAAEDGRHYNFNRDLFEKIVDLVDSEGGGRASPRDIFNYIYGVLHCPGYRSVYKEFLKIGYPRIPWPASSEEFWSVSEKGGKLIKLHLMDPEVVGDVPHPLLGTGDDVVSGKPEFSDGKIWINAIQCFEDVPEHVWHFRIGNNYPAQDWLKRRKGMALEYEDVQHYQSILNILSDTHQIMETITMKLPD